MSTVWGPPIWTLFHTIIEHTNDADFSKAGPVLFIFIRRICSLLPCPECQAHAKGYLANLHIDMKSKDAVRTFIYKFHNAVNRYKKLPEPPIDILTQYQEKGLADAYNAFVVAFSSRGSVRLLTDTMHRTMLIRDFKSWLITNTSMFY